jgi:hypothetical protein
MKRQAIAGTVRGPVGVNRQRRTLRLVQVILVLIAAGLLMFGGYALGKSAGYEDGQSSDELGGPSKPGIAETIVPVVLGLGALGAAIALQGPSGLRMPTPARLDELAGRAEDAAIDRAETTASERDPEEGSKENPAS